VTVAKGPAPQTGIDPSAVETSAELASCLDALRNSRDLSLSRLKTAASRLPTRNGRRQTLPSSTVSDMLNAKSMPSLETLLTFLEVCGVGPGDRQNWLGAWERAKNAHLRRPAGAVRVREADARRLGVHAAIQVDGAVGDLPAYVPRDVDDELHSGLAEATRVGGFLLLVGSSSVGKTRTLYEAVRAQVPDWWLLHPTSGAEVRALAAVPVKRTVVWLDGLQEFLDGPDRLTAGTARALMGAGVVLVATIWPQEYDTRIAATRSAGDHRYAGNRELLDLATLMTVSATLTPAELDRAQQLAVDDGRLRVALQAGAPGLTQVLAAGPDLVRRWEEASNPYAAAVITTAVDARRLGMQAPITPEQLQAAVPGYLTTVQQAEAAPGWFEPALDFATEKLRGAASALTAVSDGRMGRAAGFVAADFLLQRGYETRRAAILPDSAWRALVEHADQPEDVRRLAYSADARWRYRYAERFHQRLASSGDEAAARRLADLLVAQDRAREAIVVLRPFAGVAHVAAGLLGLLVRDGDLDGLRGLAAQGDLVAAAQLVALLAGDDIDELRARAADGDRLATAWLADLDGGEARLDRLRQRADGGDRLALGHLAEVLAERGRIDEAINLLQTRAEAGDRLAADHLADLLARYDRTAQLQQRADAGDDAAEMVLDAGRDAGIARYIGGGHLACRLSDALAEQGHIDDAIAVMQAHASAAIGMADDYLVDMLVNHGRLDLLRQRAATGDWPANIRLADLAANTGDVDQLWALDAEGNWFATQRLADIMVSEGRPDDAIGLLRARADAGDALAAGSLPDLLAEHGQVDELQARAAEDPWYAPRAWARYLVEHDRLPEAMEWLRNQGGPGAGLAASQLADLLVAQDRIEEAIAILRPFTIGYGDGPAVSRLVDLLYRHERVNDLRTEVNAGVSGAADRLLQLLLRHDGIDHALAARIRAFGLTATWPADGTRP